MHPLAKVGILVLLTLILCNMYPVHGASKCLKGDPPVSGACDAGKPECKLSSTGIPEGCVANKSCSPIPPPNDDDTVYHCNKTLSCCTCGGDDCNELIKSEDDKNKFCYEYGAEVKDFPLCANYKEETTTDNSFPANKGSGVSVVSASTGTTFMLAAFGTYLTYGLVHSS